jgi:hypothetical protein
LVSGVTCYLEAFGIALENPEPIAPRPNDRVTIGTATNPVWRVVHVDGPDAWVRREDMPWMQGLAPVARMRFAAEIISLEKSA